MQKCKQVCVSKLHFFSSCPIDMNKFFKKKDNALNHVYSSFSVDYGFNNNKHTFA